MRENKWCRYCGNEAKILGRCPTHAKIDLHDLESRESDRNRQREVLDREDATMRQLKEELGKCILTLGDMNEELRKLHDAMVHTMKVIDTRDHSTPAYSSLIDVYHRIKLLLCGTKFVGKEGGL